MKKDTNIVLLHLGGPHQMRNTEGGKQGPQHSISKIKTLENECKTLNESKKDISFENQCKVLTTQPMERGLL